MNRILFFFLQFFAIGILFAQNNFSHKPISVSQNSEFSIEFVANTEDSMGAFQMDLELDNSNFTFTSEAVEIIDDDYSISYNFIDDNILRIVAYTTSEQIAAFNNESIFKLNIKSLNNPGDYNINVSNLIASDTEANQIEINFQSSVISVLGPKLNLDGQQINFNKIGLNSRYNSSFYIRNDGNESLDINNIEFPDIFEVDESLPLMVSAGERRYINFSLDTSKEIAVNDSITFVTNDSDAQRSSQFIKVQGEVFTSNILRLSNASANNRVPTTINLNLENQEECFGVQLDVVLPNNFEFDSDNLSLSERAAGFLISSSKINENTHRLLVFSTTKESISPGNGPILLFQIIPDTNAGVYNLEIQNAMVIGADQQNALTDVYGSTFNVYTPVFRVFNDVIDLEELNSNTKKDFTINTNNDSNQEIVIDSLNYNNSFISIEDISYPRKIIPYDNFNINASFISSEIGEFNEEIKIYHNGDNSPSIVSVSGTILGQNFLFSDDVIINPAASNNNYLKINIQNDEQVRGIQFDLNVSEDINLDFENLIVLSSLQNFTVSNSALTNGEQRFIIFTTTSKRLPKGNNPLIQIPISTELKNGSYDVLFEEVFISGSTNSDIATTPSVVGSIEIDYNVPPNASTGELITDEDTAVTLDLTEISGDLDGDSLEYSFADPTNGTVTLADGVVTYTPNDDFFGSDSFTYSVYDNTKTTIDYTISVTINSINDIPTSGPTAVTIEEDTIVDIDISELISDVEDDALTVVIDTNPTQGNVSLIETGFKYIPKADYSGTDAFTYFVVDSGGAKSNVSEVKITVNDVNDAPIASDINSSTKQDTALILTVDVSDKDSEFTNLQLVADQEPLNGQVVVNGFKLTYSPASSYSGFDSFTYYLLDTTDSSVSKIYTVNITVLEEEQILDKNPTVASLEVNGEQDKELGFTLQGTDPNNLELIYEISSAPLNGTVTIEENKAIYVPAAGYFGEDSFSYSAINIEQLASNIGKVSITVYEKQNNAPAAYNDRVSVFIGETVSFDLNGNDPEGNTLTYLLEDSTNLDSNVVLNSSTGVATVTHSGIVGEETFTFVVNDGLTNSEVATVTILGIQKPNNRPFVRNKLLKLKRKLGLSYNLTLAGNLNVSDADGFNTLSEFEATNLPSFITSVEHAFISTTSTLKITNNISFESSEMYPTTSTFEYTVKDEQGLSSIPGQISIYIDEVEINNPPKSYGYSIPMPSNNTVKLLGYDEDLDSIAFEITEVINASIENIAPDNGSGWSVAYVKFVRTNNENAVSISYKVNDGTDSSSISTITLN